MSKLRNHSGNTTVGMAQWIGRKIRHHDPVSGADDHIKTRAGGQMRVGINAADPLEVVYVTAGGKRFAISVREITHSEPSPALVAVGS